MPRLDVVNFLGTFPNSGTGTFIFPSDVPKDHSIAFVWSESTGASGVTGPGGNGPWTVINGGCGPSPFIYPLSALTGSISVLNVTDPITAGQGFNAAPMSCGLVYELNNTIESVLTPPSDADNTANFPESTVHDSLGSAVNPDLIFALIVSQDYNSNGLLGGTPAVTGGGGMVGGIVTVPWTNATAAGPNKGRVFGFTNDDYSVATAYIVNPGTDTFSITGTGAGDISSCTVIGFVGTNRWSNPANLEASDGSYHTVYAKNDGHIYHKRYPFTSPHSDGVESTVTTGTADTEPRIAEDRLRRRLWVVFSRSGDVYSTYSDDNGTTWSTPSSILMASKHPIVRYDPVTGAMYVAALVSGTPNTIQATIQYPGDTSPSSAFTLKDQAGANINPDDDGFEIAPSGDGASRWTLVFISGGVVKNYVSFDNGHTFTLVS